MQITAHFAHSVRFRDNGTPLSSFEFYNNRVVGTPEINNLVVSKWDMRHAANVVSKFAENMRKGAWGTAAYSQPKTSGYRHETSWPESTKKRQELTIGDLVWTLVYNCEACDYVLTRTAFDLQWSDFQYFVERWHQFVIEGE